ncbi:MAG: PVC-type heme-binding CxxCH protein, partial [Planctomycetota bacterium]|nr:PVC-type heme-binding CxxCH protein [Planctomycetota bacterium]
YVVIAPDYPSFGDLQDHQFAEDEFESGTLQGIVNHMRCVDYLQTLDFVDPRKIGVIGHSLGGHNAIFVAAFDPRLKAVVTSCGWTPFHDYYQGKIDGWTSQRYMPLLKSRFGLDPDQVPFDFYELVAALAPRPFFTNSPLLDSNFEVAGVKKAIPKIKQIYSLFSAANQVQAVYPKCRHDFPSEIRTESYRFLDKALEHVAREEIGFGGELPRIEPLEPQEAIKSFNQIEISLAAHEPVVHDPIAMAFDEHRRLFVVEMKDYSEQEKDFLGRIRLLVDEDQDGIYEKSTLYADQLSWPTAIICYDGGVFVGAAPDLWFFKDTDQDGKADIRRKVFSGFGRGNVQGLMNSLRWGLDNRIHGVASNSGGNVFRVGDPLRIVSNLRGKDFSFDPKTLDLRRETGGAQHGMCFDDTGTKFVCSNSDHAQVVLYDDRYLARNPYHRGIRARQSIAVDGGQAPVFRTSPVEPWRIVRTRLRVAGRVPGPVEGGGTAAGYFTGSTGITIYRGDAGAVDKGVAIIGDVGSNIVHQKKINRTGLDITATRIDKNSELVTSTDNWFRPVQFGNAPDGCLYILDMYREVIEHPKSLPPMIKKHLDLTFGRDRGRIYRLGKPKLNRKQEIEPETMSSLTLVQFLDHPNSWHRETAARLIYQKQDASCVPRLQTVIRGEFSPLGRLHALYALSGLQKLTLEDLQVASKDTDSHIRRHAILLAEQSNPQWLLQPPIRNLDNDPSSRVRLQMAFSIGEVSPLQRKPVIWRLMQNSPNHPLMVTAIMSSANGIQSEILAELANTKSLKDTAVGQAFVKNLVDQISKRNTQSDFKHLTSTLLDLIRQRKDETAMQLTLTMCSANAQLKTKLLKAANLKEFFKSKLKTALGVAVDPTAKPSHRIRAIQLLSLTDLENVTASLLKLITVEQPVAIQLAALETLGDMKKNNIGITLIQRRNRVGKEAANKITELLLSRTEWTRLFLEQAKASDLPPGQLQVLEK